MNNLKILYVGNTHIPHASENLVVRQLVREGHNVIPFEYPTILGTDYEAVNKELFKELDKTKVDLLIVCKCMGLTAEMIKKIKVPKVSWLFDLFRGYITWKRSEWYEKQSPSWDCCFGAEAGQVDYYKRSGINYFPLKVGADPEWNRKVKPDEDYKEYGCDVSFLGGIYNQLRINMASRIKCIPNVSFKNFVGYMVQGQMIPGIFMEDLSGFANYCRITIGCNYRNDIEGYWSKRIYELQGSNMFMINAFVKGMEKEGFKHKKNTVFFYNDNFDEMTELIEYYLREENQEERLKIREEGYKLIHSRHMMKHRTKEFFKVLKRDGII